MSEHDHEPSGATAPAHSDRKSGRAVFDNDGRSIWEWQTATGVFTRNVTDDQLSMLSTVTLEIDETAHEAQKAKVFTTTRYPMPAQAATRASRGSKQAKKETRGLAAWLKRGWLG